MVAQRARVGREILWVLLIGLISSVLYLVVYLAQRGIFLNGILSAHSHFWSHLYPRTIVRGGEPPRWTLLLLQYAAYVGATIGLFALYTWLLALCRRERLHGAAARRLALLFPVVFNLALLFGRPYLSLDAYSSTAYGYLGAAPGGNPYIQATGSLERTLFGAHLVAFGWRPVHLATTYGPLWTHVEILAWRLTANIALAVFLMKVLVVVASLGSAALIWTILTHVRPRDRLLGTLAYLWNPVVVVEVAAEGHNDTLMIFCVLAAVLFSIRARAGAGLVALLLGALAKYLPLIFLPAQVLYVWRTQRHRPRLPLRLLVGLAIGLGLGVLLYRPFWIGPQIFGMLLHLGRPAVQASISGVFMWVLLHSHFRAEAAQVTSLLFAGIFSLYTLVTSWRVRDTESLLKGCAGIALIYVLVGSAQFHPWYVLLPLALMALSPWDVFRWMIPVLALCARLVAPLDAIYLNGLLSFNVAAVCTTAIATALPLALFVLLAAPRRLASAPGLSQLPFIRLNPQARNSTES